MEPDGSFPFSQELFNGPILSQMNPVHTTPSYFSKIHFNIIPDIPHGRNSQYELDRGQGRLQSLSAGSFCRKGSIWWRNILLSHIKGKG
jgi:hypothetical protein